MKLRCLALFGLLAVQFAFAREAWAEEPTPPPAVAPVSVLPPLVLTVNPAPGMDVERLRKAIAAETHREVVLSTDPRAAAASGGERLSVTISAGRTRVRFEPSPRERDMPSEAGVDAQLRQAALLAANVVAGEADDILSDLRKSRGPGAKQSPGPVSATMEATNDANAAKTKEDELAYERLEGTLRYHSESNWGGQLALGLTAIGASFVMVPVGLYVWQGLDEPISGSALAGMGLGSFVVGTISIISSFAEDPPLRDLHRHLVSQHGSQPSGALVMGVEKEWREKGARSTRTLHWIGGFSLGLGVLGMAVGTGEVLSAPNDRNGRTHAATGALAVGTGALVSIFGVAALLTKSPVETDYEAYARASKRPSISPGVTPLAGGAAFSLSGRF